VGNRGEPAIGREAGTLRIGSAGGDPGAEIKAACGNGAEMESRPSGTGLWLPAPGPGSTEKCDEDGGAVVVRGLSARGATVGGNLGLLGLRGRLTGGGRGAGGVGVTTGSFCGELAVPPTGPTALEAGERLEGDSGGPVEGKEKLTIYDLIKFNFNLKRVLIL